MTAKPDPATLREALTAYDTEGQLVGDDVFDAVFAAARWALDLIEEGKEVWCCIHNFDYSLTLPQCRKCGQRLWGFTDTGAFTGSGRAP